MVDDINQWLQGSSLTQQTMAALRPDLHRWERRLRRLGITSIPHPVRSWSWSQAEELAHNVLILWFMQSKPVRDKAAEHQQRNLIRNLFRAYKP
jgi:hypothetical protein